MPKTSFNICEKVLNCLYKNRKNDYTEKNRFFYNSSYYLYCSIIFRKSKISNQEEELLTRVFGYVLPLPTNISLDDYDHVNVKEFFREKGTDYPLNL